MIGDCIRKLRKAQGIAQYQLAEKALISPITLCRVESGQHVPIPAVVKTIADALGVTVEDLTEEE